MWHSIRNLFNIHLNYMGKNYNNKNLYKIEVVVVLSICGKTEYSLKLIKIQISKKR